MKYRPIESDPRYTVCLEWCGYKEQRYCARFCGDWIGQSLDYPGAVLKASGHRLERNGALIITEIPA